MRVQEVWFFSLFVALRCFVGVVQPDTVAAENLDLLPLEWIQILPDKVLDQRGDEADVYFPEPPADLRSSFEDAFPVVAMLQGGLVDKKFYEQFGRRLARFGFVVVIPNHFQFLPFLCIVPVPFPDEEVIRDVLTQIQQEDTDYTSPLFGIVDTARMGLAGHSAGGAAGLFAIGRVCQPPFCFGPPFFPLPEEVQAGAFYGTNTIDPISGELIDVNTDGIAVALVQGSLDSLATLVEAEDTFDILDGPRELVTIEGANHYGITDMNNPPAAPPVLPSCLPNSDENEPALPQAEAVQQVADAIGQLLSANLKGTRVTLCHKGKKTKTLPLPAVSAHLNHGDTLGACS